MFQCVSLNSVPIFKSQRWWVTFEDTWPWAHGPISPGSTRCNMDLVTAVLIQAIANIDFVEMLGVRGNVPGSRPLL